MGEALKHYSSIRLTEEQALRLTLEEPSAEWDRRRRVDHWVAVEPTEQDWAEYRRIEGLYSEVQDSEFFEWDIDGPSLRKPETKYVPIYEEKNDD